MNSSIEEPPVDETPAVRILIIDDDQAARVMVRESLAREFSAATFEEITDHVGFFRAMKGLDFDLAITEQNVHWSTGIEILLAIKSLQPLIPVIMLVQSEDPEISSDALRQGLDAYIVKSDSFEAKLHAALRSALQIVEYSERVENLEERHEARLEQLEVGVFRVAVDGRLLECNPTFARLIGAESPEAATAVNLGELFVNPDLPTEILKRLNEEDEIRDLPVEIQALDGRHVWLSICECAAPASTGDLVIDGLAVDVSELKRGEEALARANAQYRVIFETSGAPTVIIDEDGTVSTANPAFRELTGYEPSELEEPRSWAEFIAHDDLEKTRDIQRRRREAPEATPRSYELRLIDRDGHPRYVSVTESLLVESCQIVASLVDVTTRRQVEEQLLHDAFHDSLTGLPNRPFLLDRLEEIVASNTRAALLLLDLDRFRVVNDGLGQRVGDTLLRAVAVRVGQAAAHADCVACLGGDQFGVLLKPVTYEEEATIVADAIRQEVERPLTTEGHEVFLSTSVGIALSETDDRADDLLRKAEAALEHAKQRGRNRWLVFEPSMWEQAREAFAIGNDLRRGFARSELELHYQPMVELATARVVGLEALVRWRHPEKGLLAPGSFLQVADETGLMIPIGRWVLTEACSHLREWRAQALAESDLFVSVNLTHRQFFHGDLLQDVGDAVSATGLSPSNVMLEITEDVLMRDSKAAAVTLERLAGFGFRACIDDFGTGFSTLGRLHQLPFQAVKIDRSFLSGIGDDAVRWRIVGQMRDLAAHLGMAVVAEGVERQDQAKRLGQLEFELAQGVLFSPAVEKEAVPDLLTKRRIAP